MNTRSQARANLPAQPNKGKAHEDFLGINLGTKENFTRFKQLRSRDVKSTKWACPATINHLRIGNDFNLLCNNVGLHPFVFQDAPTYR